MNKTLPGRVKKNSTSFMTPSIRTGMGPKPITTLTGKIRISRLTHSSQVFMHRTLTSSLALTPTIATFPVFTGSPNHRKASPSPAKLGRSMCVMSTVKMWLKIGKRRCGEYSDRTRL